MGIVEQAIKQNQQALIPHEWQVFEQALSKPFFLGHVHKAPMVNPQKNISGE